MMTTMTTMTTRAMSTSIDGRRGRGKERARGRMTTTTVEKVAGWRRRGRVRGVVGGGDDDVRVGKTVVGGGVGVGVGGVDARRRVGTTTGRARGRARGGRGGRRRGGRGRGRGSRGTFSNESCVSSRCARAAWIAVVVVAAAAASGTTPPSAVAAAAAAKTPKTATTSSGIVHEFHELKARVRIGSTNVMRTTLRTVGSAIEKIEEKTQEDWHIVDIWVLFAWNWLTRHGRRKAFDAIERAKNNMNPSRTPRTFEKSILHWLVRPMQVIQGLFILGYGFDVGCDMIDQLSTEWEIPEYIKLGWDKGSYTFAMGILIVMSIQNYGPRTLGRLFPSMCRDASVQLVITRLTSAVVVVATLMATLAAFGIPAEVLFSFGGLGGLAFGLAAKDFISNLIGGLVLAVMRPFKVGEKIFLTGGGGKYRDSKEKDVSNYKVDEIGWYQTRLIPKDGKVTTIPNGYFLGANVINSSREPNEWVAPAIRIAIPDFEGVEPLTKEIREYLNTCADVNSSYKEPECWLKKIDADHLLVQIEMFMHGDKHYGREKLFKLKRQELLVDLIRIVRKHCPNSPAIPIEIGGYEDA